MMLIMSILCSVYGGKSFTSTKFQFVNIGLRIAIFKEIGYFFSIEREFCSHFSTNHQTCHLSSSIFFLQTAIKDLWTIVKILTLFTITIATLEAKAFTFKDRKLPGDGFD